MIRASLAVTFTASALAVACSAGAPSPENIGRASAAIAEVPAQVGCIEIDVTGARSVEARFDVTPGTSSVLSLTGLPLGLDTFVGLAYPGACSAVSSATQATWISDATQASLVEQQVAPIALSLHPDGQSSVIVSFDGDDGGAADAAPDVLTCAVPLALCAGACTDTTQDPLNCGACGAACTAPNTAAASCVAGACQVAICPTGSADCDRNFANGCETDVSSSVTSCGSCGNVCPIGPNVLAPLCASGACRVGTCAAGFTDCDNNPFDGCEADLANSGTNCGACGRVCASGVCSSGQCL